MYRTSAQSRFDGGLNLTEGADVVRPEQCVDCLNVVYLLAGGVAQRSGYKRFTSAELTNQPDSLYAHYESDGTKQLIVGNGNRLDVLNTSGASIANVATTASPHSFVRFAAPGSEHTLIANGTDTVRRWDGAAFSTPAYTGTTPTGRFLAVQATDNRLACARTSANPDRVLFSDPGVPTTFGANNYVDLHPGSGEAITGLVAWREYVFAFKESEFFVFYGNGTGATGAPVFNFRAVSGAGCVGAVCVAPEGVYFLDRRGVYRTTGGAPELVSGALDPLFLGGSSLYYQGGEADPSLLASARLHWSQGRLYLAFATSSTNNRVAVLNPAAGWWTLFDMPVAAMASFRPSSREELLFAYASGSKRVGRYFEDSGFAADDTLTDDTGGNAITSRWRQGWVDYGSQDQKQLRQSKLWGEGTAQFGFAVDFQQRVRWTPATRLSATTDTWGGGTGSDLWGDGSGSDLWGPAGTTRPWLLSQSAVGHVIAFAVQNSTLRTSWGLHRVEHGFRGVRGPEVVGAGS